MPGGKSLTSIYTFSCLDINQATHPSMILTQVLVGKLKLSALIDTGATATFIPHEGQIMRLIQPEIRPFSSTVHTASREAVPALGKATITIQPIGCIQPAIQVEVVVLQTGGNILGQDLVLGLPEFHALRAQFNFETLPPTITWGKVEEEALSPSNNQHIGCLALTQHHHTLNSRQEKPHHNQNSSHILDQETVDNHQKNSKITNHMNHSTHSIHGTHTNHDTRVNHDIDTTNCSIILKRFESVFATSLNGSVMKIQPAQIKLRHYKPIITKARRHSQEDIIAITEQVKRLKRSGIIELSQSQYSANCRTVPKKNGKHRLIINYIPLNRATIEDQYPLPMITEILGTLAGHKFFSVLDATEGFHQVNLHPDSRHFTAFLTPIGLYQYKRVPFGFTNSPAIFQRAINEVLGPGLYRRCAAYVDDIIVFGRTQEEHDDNLQWVLSRCQHFNFKINPSKCQFSKNSIKFLGRLISDKGISPLLDDLNFLDNTTKYPTNKAEVRSLLGSLQFIARFIPNFSEITRPLVELTRKDAQFLWQGKHSEVVETIKRCITEAKPQPLLPRNTRKTINLYIMPQSVEVVCTDASGNLIERASRSLAESEQNYTLVEKNLLALILAYNKFEAILDNQMTTFITECPELLKELKLKKRPRRVEHLMLQLPPGIEPNLELKEAISPERRLVFDKTPPEATFYTDGASNANGKENCRAGWGVYCLEYPELSKNGLVENSPSNQTAEVQAAIEACKIAKTKNFKDISIVSDSKYVLNAVTVWIPKWIENNFTTNRRKQVINIQHMKELIEAKEGLNINWFFVQGHNNDFGNEKADELAKAALLPHQFNALAIFDSEEQRRDSQIEAVFDNIDNYQDKFIIRDELLYYIDRPVHGNHVNNDNLGNNVSNANHVNNANGIQRLVVPKSQRALLLRLSHDDQLYGGHLGVRKTLKKLKSYWWPGIASDVAKFVRGCDICQKFKGIRGPPPGKLHSIPVSRLFERIHMDIVGEIHLETAKKSKYIITAIDAYSRFAFAKAVPEVKTEHCIEFLEEIISIHGCPEHIVTDKGAQFTSNKWSEYTKELGIKHNTTTPYHPQSNGMDERFNGSLCKILRSYVNQHQNTWDNHLKWAVFVYNTSFHESIRMSPYQVMYGVQPRTPLNLRPSGTVSQAEARRAIREAVVFSNKQAQETQKRFYDRTRKVPNFKIGQSVLVKSHKISAEEARKFAYKWTSPAIILNLPTSSDNDEPRYVQLLNFYPKAHVHTASIQDIKAYHTRPDDLITTNVQQGIEQLALNNRERSDSFEDHVSPTSRLNHETRDNSSNNDNNENHENHETHVSPNRSNTPSVPSQGSGTNDDPIQHNIYDTSDLPLPEVDQGVENVSLERNYYINLDSSQDSAEEQEPQSQQQHNISRRKQTLPRIRHVSFDRPFVRVVDDSRDWLQRPTVSELPDKTFDFVADAGSTPQYEPQPSESPQKSPLETIQEVLSEASFASARDSPETDEPQLESADPEQQQYQDQNSPELDNTPTNNVSQLVEEQHSLSEHPRTPEETAQVEQPLQPLQPLQSLQPLQPLQPESSRQEEFPPLPQVTTESRRPSQRELRDRSRIKPPWRYS